MSKRSVFRLFHPVDDEVYDPETNTYIKKEKKKTTLRDENVQKVIKASKKSKADTIKSIFNEQ